MHTPQRTRLWFALCGTLVFAGWTLCAQWLSGHYGGWQFVRVQWVEGAWWQPLTAQWVHLSIAHAVANVLGAGVLLHVLEAQVPWRVQMGALLGGYVGVALVVCVDRHCAYYAGASGALHGLWLGGLLAWLWRVLTAKPWQLSQLLVVGCLLLALLAKLVFQGNVFTDSQARWSPAGGDWLGIPVYHPAHVAGALGGVLGVVLHAVFFSSRNAYKQ